jgi:hypothetical protein
MSDSSSSKSLIALANGIIRHDYYDDYTITDDLLKQELFATQSNEEFSTLLNRVRGLIKSMANSNMDQPQAETFLISQTKKHDGSITEQQSKVLLQCWKVHRMRVHESILRRSVWNNRLCDINWRIDVKSRSRSIDQINTAAAIVELHLNKSDTIEQSTEVVRLEMDESGLAKVLHCLKNIEEQIDRHGKFESSSTE